MTRQPASDFGYLLRMNPALFQTEELSFGKSLRVTARYGGPLGWQSMTLPFL
jgi:hypothetical protein